MKELIIALTLIFNASGTGFTVVTDSDGFPVTTVNADGSLCPAMALGAWKNQGQY